MELLREPVAPAQRMLLILGVLVACAGPARPRVVSALQDRAAPDFVARRQDGSELRLAAFRGRVVVLDLWASWCRGCQEKLPILDAMARRLRSAGVETLAVSLDAEYGQFVRALDGRSWQMTPLFDSSGRLGDLYQPTELPSIFIVDAGGVVREAIHGYVDSDLIRIEARARSLVGAELSPGL